MLFLQPSLARRKKAAVNTPAVRDTRKVAKKPQALVVGKRPSSLGYLLVLTSDRGVMSRCRRTSIVGAAFTT